MFDRIAPRYDRVNRLMTFSADQRWRRELVERLAVGRGTASWTSPAGLETSPNIAAGAPHRQSVSTSRGGC
jgi:hypothetical protein